MKWEVLRFNRCCGAYGRYGCPVGRQSYSTVASCASIVPGVRNFLERNLALVRPVEGAALVVSALATKKISSASRKISDKRERVRVHAISIAGSGGWPEETISELVYKELPTGGMTAPRPQDRRGRHKQQRTEVESAPTWIPISVAPSP